MAHMNTSAPRMAMGMEVPTINDAFQSPKKKKMMAMEMITAMIMVSNTLDREDLMVSALSSMMVISSSGSAACSFRISSCTWVDSVTAESSCTFVMPRVMVSVPLKRPMALWSCSAVPTSAMSRR